MVPHLRKQYNERFTEQNYNAYLKASAGVYPGKLDFRIAETPIYIDKDFTKKVLSVCEHVIDVIQEPSYHSLSQKAIPKNLEVPDEDNHPHCIAFDFGICQSVSGALEPQLIELQGFPSLFAWEIILPEIHQKHFWTPDNYSVYLSGFDKAEYIKLLQKIIIGDCSTQNVILLELFPEKQKTRVDFYATKTFLGIDTVCLTEIIQEGKNLYYLKDGSKTLIKRIYNRVIFDDLLQQSTEIQEKGKIFQQSLNLTWVPHPNWFYKISKFTLPFIKHRYVPETQFLHEAKIPHDLENYVIKPLFSFAGQGVIIDVSPEDLKQIKDPQNWILQKKVLYADAIQTPAEPAKAELRIFYLWESDKPRPVATNNLARLSKGKMIGVRYNKDKLWVGGSFCLFEN
ncbi:MAG: hypothetical protein NVS1B13_24980 [Flavisolibacter sp.]